LDLACCAGSANFANDGPRISLGFPELFFMLCGEKDLVKHFARKCSNFGIHIRRRVLRRQVGRKAQPIARLAQSTFTNFH
jgi:hypothetical protein